MEGMLPKATSEARSYTDFEPHYEWLRSEESDTLLVDVLGFNKQQLKVLIKSGNLKISGERPIDGKKWIRFLKDFVIPKYSNPKGLRAKFDGDEGLLYVILPKLASQQVNPQDQPTQAQQSLPGSKATLDDTIDAPKMPEKPEEQRDVAAESEEIAKAGSGQQKLRQGVSGAVMRISKQKLLVVHVAVAIMVIVGIGIYLAQKLRISRGTNSN